MESLGLYLLVLTLRPEKFIFLTKKMKESKVTLSDPCNLVSAKIRRNSNIWDTFNTPIFPIEEKSSEAHLKQSKGWKKYIGIFFAVLCSMVYSLSSVVVQGLQSYHPLNVSSWRFQVVVIPNMFILTYYWINKDSSVIRNITPLSEPESKRNLWILLIRGVLGSFAIVTNVYSLQYLTVADSTVICFSTPVFVTFLAHFMLGETLGFVPVLTSISTILGVFVITRPPILTGAEISTDTLIGIGVSLISMGLQAFILIVVRSLKGVHSALITSSFGIVGTLVCVTISVGFGLFELPYGSNDWLLAASMGALTFLGQLFYTLALQYEEAGPVSLVRCGDVIFAFIWQFVFFGTQPDVFSVIGAVIVIGGVLIIGLRKWIEGLPVENDNKKRFRFLLL